MPAQSFHMPFLCSLGSDTRRLGDSGLTSDPLLAVLARVSFTGALGDDNAFFADGSLTLVALHQMLAVIVALFTDGATAVFLPATVTNDSGAAKQVCALKMAIELA